MTSKFIAYRELHEILKEPKNHGNAWNFDKNPSSNFEVAFLVLLVISLRTVLLLQNNYKAKIR